MRKIEQMGIFKVKRGGGRNFNKVIKRIIKDKRIDKIRNLVVLLKKINKTKIKMNRNRNRNNRIKYLITEDI